MKATPGNRAGLILMTLGLLCTPGPAPAHEGEVHGTPAPSSGAMGGPVKLSATARANLDLLTVPVESRVLTLGPGAFGMVELRPGHSQVVAARISGRVVRVTRVVGDAVRAGEPLIELEARVVADPPPHVTLTSPRAGTLVRREVEPGQPVEPDQSLLTIADLSRVNFRADIYEVDLAQVAVGQRAVIRLEAYPDRAFDGTIVRLGQSADAATRTVPAWIELANPDGALRLNLRGRARIATGAGAPVLAVPTEAILGDAANRFVYLDDGVRFVPTPVEVGATDGAYTEIRSGLLPGDPIVTRGAYELQFVITPAAAPATKAKAKK